MNSRKPIRDRRTATTSLSVRVLEFLLGRGYTQADVARMLGLSQGFISLVKSRERGFRIEHLSEFADRMGLPLGAFLLATEKPEKTTDPERIKFLEVTERLIRKADEVHEAIRGKTSAGK